MDKVILTVDDVKMLLTWRDSHLTEVLSAPAPLKAVEVCIKESQMRFKAVKSGDDIQFHLSHDFKSLGTCTLRRMPDGLWKATKKRFVKGITDKDIESMLSVYCSLMAFMVYGKAVADDDEYAVEEKTAGKKTPHSGHNRRTSPTTYIITKTKTPNIRLAKSSHASPSSPFTVRGHYRHYKSGKVVWINEYRKGIGNKKTSKTYKISKG